MSWFVSNVRNAWHISGTGSGVPTQVKETAVVTIYGTYGTLHSLEYIQGVRTYVYIYPLYSLGTMPLFQFLACQKGLKPMPTHS